LSAAVALVVTRALTAGVVVGGAPDRRWLWIGLIVAVPVLVVSTLLAIRGVDGWEIAAFQAVNGLPDGIRPYLWVLNQYGTAITIPIATVVALVFRRWTLALCLAVSGIGVYVLAKVVKGFVERGRPAALVDGVVEREPFAPESLGFPSGHAAVAWAITIVVLVFLGRPWRIVAIALAIAVPLCRLYVAAHLPLDLIGGAALGVAVASIVCLTVAYAQRAHLWRTEPEPAPT
jgi:membrane-associated phospholipid phosphatase